jgi:eukaryotic-like serine/threonine-protein kinase
MALPPGTRLGPYDITAKIGEGGMGEVYKARDTRLDRTVAIKVLPEACAADSDRLRRFEHEARAIAALNHPHICQLHDIGPGYLVLEYIDGRRLQGPISVDEAVRLALQMASALEAAHQQGILHRDLKPANIMVTRGGAAKLLDFGLAKVMGSFADDPNDVTRTVAATVTGTVLGTVAYMSPEQAEGKPLDARSDIFSFGVVLYEILSGVRAFAGENTAQVISAVLRDEPRSIPAPPALERIVRRCLSKQPIQRFQSMGELRAALERAAIEMVPQNVEYEPSIAVLPFANMSADKENEFFSDGLAEEIIHALAQVRGIKVAGRTSSFFFRGKDVEFGEIGRRLNVEHILEGSVRRAGNRIRVTAQLIKVADGFHLWSERYDRELTDVFAIQDEITHAITEVLRLKLSPHAAVRPRREPDLRAYEAYVTARAQWFKGTSESQARFKESIDRAIALDPEFAQPHFLLGGYYSMVAGLGIMPARQVIPLARAAAEEALRLDPSLFEAHALLGVVAGTFSYDWGEAERQWHLALAREPVSREVRLWYGNHYLLPIGRSGEAVEEMAWGVEADPLNLLYRHHWARGLRNAGRLQEAEDELRKVLGLDENFPYALRTLGSICAQQGRFEEALALTERVHALTPWANIVVGQLAALLVRTGDKGRAEALLETLRRGVAYGAPTGVAIFHAMCGELDRATEWAARALDERYPEFLMILRPWLESSPQWPALARLVNLRL